MPTNSPMNHVAAHHQAKPNMSGLGARGQTRWRYSQIFGDFQYDQVADEIVLREGRRFPRPRQISAASLLSQPDNIQVASPGRSSIHPPLSDRTFQHGFSPLTPNTGRLSKVNVFDTARNPRTSPELGSGGDEEDDNSEEEENSDSDSIENVDESSEEDLEDDENAEKDGNDIQDEEHQSDENPNRNSDSGSAIQRITCNCVPDPQDRMVENNSHSEGGIVAVAAFQKYSLQVETSEVRLIEFSDLQIPAELSARLLDPTSSDAPVRRYFRSAFGNIHKEISSCGRADDRDSTAEQLIAGLLERELKRHDPDETCPQRDPQTRLIIDLHYAHAKALLTNDNIETALVHLQEAVSLATSVSAPHELQAYQRLLVHAWRKSGESSKAILLLNEMIRQQRVQCGEEHPSVLVLLQALAAALEADQQASEAVCLLEQVLMIQIKTHGQHHRSQTITLHLLLRSQASAGQEVEVTISRIIELSEYLNSSPSPLQAISQHANSTVASSQKNGVHDSRPQPQQAGHAVNGVPDSSNDASSLQRLVDHAIDSQPLGTHLPRELQGRVAAYVGSKHVPLETPSPIVLNDQTACQPAEALHPPPISTPSVIESISATTVTAASSTLVELSATTGTSGSTAIAVAAIGLAGAIGVMTASLFKTIFVDLPQLQLSRQTELREKTTADADLRQKRLDIIKGLAMAEEELIRKDAESAAREEKLKESNERYQKQLDELRKQVEAAEEDRKQNSQTSLQRLKQSQQIQSQQAEKIKRLEQQQLRRAKDSEEQSSRQAAKFKSMNQQLEACRSELRNRERKGETFVCMACHRSVRGQTGDGPRAAEPLDSSPRNSRGHQEDRAFPHSGHEMTILRPANARLDLEHGVVPASTTRHATEQSKARFWSELKTAQTRLVTQRYEIEDLKDELKASKRETDEAQAALKARTAACQCGDLSIIETCLSCAKSRSSIRALRHDLDGGNFDGNEIVFLSDLDPARHIHELVPILCERLKGFVQTLYEDLLPLHENEKRGLEAKLRDADTIIADYQDRLANSQCKKSRLEHQLKEARLELKEALASATDHGRPPVHLEPVQQAAPWVGLRWRFR